RRSNVWIDIDSVHQISTVEAMGEYFHIHPLVLEDITNTDQRPKMEELEDYIYISLNMLSYDENRREIISEQVSLLIYQGLLISFQEGIEGDLFDPIRERLRHNKGKVRKLGADYLAYSLIDSIVDNYFVILEKIGEKIEILEEELVENPTSETLQNLHRMKREMLFLRKSVWPLREVIAAMQRSESELIGSTTKVYLRDLYDHTIQVIDTMETFRDMLSGMLDIYLSSISNRLNNVMKVLTIIATIFMPLTFIAGIYGMNFKYMPELEWKYGYAMSLSIMAVTAFIMVIYFKKKDWF
ncbi:MAG: magnesium/cobalt transporter CorA, partial [Blastocatellia bacterium]|nr:magnesium/cobalt transporter CorA [Blastocatellia bacterium]